MIKNTDTTNNPNTTTHYQICTLPHLIGLIFAKFYHYTKRMVNVFYPDKVRGLTVRLKQAKKHLNEAQNNEIALTLSTPNQTSKIVHGRFKRKLCHASSYDNIQTKSAKETLSRWIASFCPSHFLSIQFPMNMRSDNFEASKKMLWQVMYYFERQLLKRHWAKKHIPFIAIAERNKSEGWHYHILFYDCKYTVEQLQVKLDEVKTSMNLTDETFELLPITETPDRVCDYCVKKIQVDTNGKLDPAYIIPSHVLFNIKAKNPQPTKKGQNK